MNRIMKSSTAKLVASSPAVSQNVVTGRSRRECTVKGRRRPSLCLLHRRRRVAILSRTKAKPVATAWSRASCQTARRHVQRRANHDQGADEISFVCIWCQRCSGTSWFCLDFWFSANLCARVLIVLGRSSHNLRRIATHSRRRLDRA